MGDAPGVSPPTRNSSVEAPADAVPAFLTTAVNRITSVVVGLAGTCVRLSTIRSACAGVTVSAVLLKLFSSFDSGVASKSSTQGPIK